MDLVKMRHPDIEQTVLVPATAVAQHALAGWAVDDSQDPPGECPVCGSPWPPPKSADSPPEAPADAGASPSTAPRRRRRTSEESD